MDPGSFPCKYYRILMDEDTEESDNVLSEDVESDVKNEEWV